MFRFLVRLLFAIMIIVAMHRGGVNGWLTLGFVWLFGYIEVINLVIGGLVKALGAHTRAAFEAQKQFKVHEARLKILEEEK